MAKNKPNNTMNLSHYHSLFFGYGAALLIWTLTNYFWPGLWGFKKPDIARPAREFGYAMLAVAGVLGIGQLYIHNLLIPKTGGFSFFTEFINQILIFSPMLVLLWLRKQKMKTAWLPLQHVKTRLSLGVAMAMIAIVVYWSVRVDNQPYFVVLINTFDYQNLSHLGQVLMEDITIAIVFVRLRAWIGTPWSIGIVAGLFAAGHIPAMIATGVNWSEFSSLLLDAALALGVLSVLQKAQDIWWFWIVHFAMDMMQYYALG